MVTLVFNISDNLPFNIYSAITFLTGSQISAGSHFTITECHANILTPQEQAEASSTVTELGPAVTSQSFELFYWKQCKNNDLVMASSCRTAGTLARTILLFWDAWESTIHVKVKYGLGLLSLCGALPSRKPCECKLVESQNHRAIKAGKDLKLTSGILVFFCILSLCADSYECAITFNTVSGQC